MSKHIGKFPREYRRIEAKSYARFCELYYTESGLTREPLPSELLDWCFKVIALKKKIGPVTAGHPLHCREDERECTLDEEEAMRAVNEYKGRIGKPFLRTSEIVRVMKNIGWHRT